jgi:hypothetical protein
MRKDVYDAREMVDEDEAQRYVRHAGNDGRGFAYQLATQRRGVLFALVDHRILALPYLGGLTRLQIPVTR